MAIPKDRQGVKLDVHPEAHTVTHRPANDSQVAMNDNSSLPIPHLLAIDGRDEKAANDNGATPVRPVFGRTNPDRFYPKSLGPAGNSNGR